MKIVLDAMGGDHAPEANIFGLLEALPHLKSEVILVGRSEEIMKFLPSGVPKGVTLVHADEVVTMEDKPIEALRKKKNSSLAIGITMVKDGEAEAFVSAGSTGAVSAGALLSWRQIEGVKRPAIASTFPNKHANFLLLDAGASPDVDPENLVDFALMGKNYSEGLMGRKDARVHLLNIGEEPGKGNAFAKEAYDHLSRFPWFAGNIEGKDLFKQKIDVVVCDAFVGNVVLKTAEGVAEYVMTSIRDRVPTGTLAKLPFLPLRKLLAPLRKQLDYAEYGGSPLLGLNGVCIICHGRSNAKAMKNALLQAEAAIRCNLVGNTRDAVQSLLTKV